MRFRGGSGVVVASLFLGFAGLAAPGDPEAALAEGNRRFEKDEVETALAAYAGGYSGEGSSLDGVLAYNAGTCALRLGRLPEALLWYRRAEVANPGDPWLRENLALVRRALGDPPADPTGRAWRAGRRWLSVAGVALAWVTLALLVPRRRIPRGLVAVFALLACTTFAAGMLLDAQGPRAAVILAACSAAEGGLPAGREVWVLAIESDGWRVLGQDRDIRCPRAAVGLVEP
jgi:tetratricopeptide (TPR) repeat protein